MPITALDVMGGVSSVIKSRKKKRKEKRKKKRLKAERKAQARDEFNSGFSTGMESTSEALGGMPTGRSGDAENGNGGNNMIMYIIGGFLVYKFLLKK